MSNLSAIPYITSPSAGTTGLWNQRYSIISANFAALNSELTLNSPSGNTFSILTNLETSGGAHFQFLSVGSTPPSYVTTAAITVEVNSAYSDYLYFIDSSAQKSSYVIGSRAGNLADGLNIWDASAGTMIASFSKQSIRFFQNVVGPVFDTGGALADTINAATFGTGADSKESRIQAAISAASIAGISRVYVPANMYPYSAGSVSFDTRVQMVREGGDWSVYDLKAYGAAGDGIADDTAAVNSVFTSVPALGGTIFLPSPVSWYRLTSTVTVFKRANLWVRGSGSLGQAPATSFLWAGQNNGTVFAFHRCRDNIFENFSITSGSTAGSPAIGMGIDLDQPAGSGMISTNNVFRKLWIGASDVGISLSSVATDNNDLMTFEHVAITHTGQAGVRIDDVNCKGNSFRACDISSRVTGIHNVFGSFALFGQRFSFNNTDIGLIGATDTIFEEFTQAEKSPVHLLATAATNQWPVTIQNCRLSAGSAVSGGFYIDFQKRGPLNLIACDLADGSHRTGIGFRLNPNTPTYSFVNSIGCVYPNKENAFVQQFSTQSYIGIMAGNIYLDPSGVAQPLNNGLDVLGAVSVVSGTSITPSVAFSSDRSLGLYLSAASTIAQSYGTFTGAILSTNTIRPESGNSMVIQSPAIGFNTSGAPPVRFTFNLPGYVANSVRFLLQDNGTSAAGIGAQFANPGSRIFLGTLDRTNNYKDWVHVDEYGTLKIQSGSSLTLSLGFSSETSLGFYRSGASTVAMSYGTLNLATQAVRFSMRTLAASSVTVSAAKTNMSVDEVVFTIGGASGASLIIYSGGTAYGFNSAFSAAAS